MVIMFSVEYLEIQSIVNRIIRSVAGKITKYLNLKNFSVRTPDDFHTLFLKGVLTLGSLDKSQASVPDLPIRREQAPSREGAEI